MQPVARRCQMAEFKSEGLEVKTRLLLGCRDFNSFSISRSMVPKQKQTKIFTEYYQLGSTSGRGAVRLLRSPPAYYAPLTLTTTTCRIPRSIYETPLDSSKQGIYDEDEGTCIDLHALTVSTRRMTR